MMVIPHWLTLLSGVLLFLGCITVWLAGWIAPLRREVEKLFTPGGDLFDSKASYAGTVTFLRWFGWFLGIMLILPMFVVADILLAGVTVLLWWYVARSVK